MLSPESTLQECVCKDGDSICIPAPVIATSTVPSTVVEIASSMARPATGHTEESEPQCCEDIQDSRVFLKCVLATVCTRLPVKMPECQQGVGFLSRLLGLGHAPVPLSALQNEGLGRCCDDVEEKDEFFDCTKSSFCSRFPTSTVCQREDWATGLLDNALWGLSELKSVLESDEMD